MAVKCELVWDCRKSSDLDEQFIVDFITVCNQVFGACCDYNSFQRKYLNNPYGESVLVLTRKGSMPVACRALWRNDLDSFAAYQAVDTAVIVEYRGKGIFNEMTARALQMIPADSIIYNFPNSNSFPAYLKLGWQVECDYRLRLFLSTKLYHVEHPIPMPDDYAAWYITDDMPFKFIVRGKLFFLVRPTQHKFCYKIVAEVSPQTAMRFPRCRWGIIFYRGHKRTFYNRKLGVLHVVAKGTTALAHIPIWKMDAI